MMYPNSKCIDFYKDFGSFIYLCSDECGDFYFYIQPKYNINKGIMRIIGNNEYDYNYFNLNGTSYYDLHHSKIYSKAINLAAKYMNLL